MTFRTAVRQDRSTVIALWQVCGLTRPWNDPARDYDLAVDGPSSAVLLWAGQGSIAGSVMVGFDGHRGWIYYLAVHPDIQRQGIGRGLMAAAEEWLAERGAPKVQLMVRDGNHAAAGFYARIGYDAQPVTTYGRFLDGQT